MWSGTWCCCFNRVIVTPNQASLVNLLNSVPLFIFSLFLHLTINFLKASNTPCASSSLLFVPAAFFQVKNLSFIYTSNHGASSGIACASITSLHFPLFYTSLFLLLNLSLISSLSFPLHLICAYIHKYPLFCSFLEVENKLYKQFWILKWTARRLVADPGKYFSLLLIC